MKSPKYTILVVDDEELIRNLIVTLLSKLGHLCVTAIDGVDALDKIKKNKIDAIVTDIKMPNMDGITLTTETSIQYPGIPVMVMTAFGEEYSAGIAISAGAREFIKKPFSLDEFSIRLHKMINDSETLRRKKSEKKDIHDLKSELGEMINDSETLRRKKSEKEDFHDLKNELEEMINDSETPRRKKSEKDVDENIHDLMNELEETLKKS